VIDTARLEATLKRLPGFERLIACDRLSAGASRETYRLQVVIDSVQRMLALRRAEGEGASAMGSGPGLNVEAKLFAAARSAGVPGPEVLLVLQPEDGLGAGFVMEWIAGETLGGKIARGAEFADARKRLARECGEILARLHAVDVKAAGLDEVLEAFTPEEIVRRTHAGYLTLNSPQPMIDFTAKWLLANLPKQHAMKLVHSDFRNGNLIVDPKQGVVAVLDWELSHVGDPMRDLGWVITRSWRFGVADKPVGGFGELEDLIAGYESASGETVDREAVRFWEVFGSFWWACGCLSMGQSFRLGMETSLERPAIGRRSSECQIDCVNLLIPGPVDPATPAGESLSATDLPRSDELLVGVRDFLRGDAAQALAGRNQFLSRVAANSLDIIMREISLGAEARAFEAEALRGLVGEGRDLQTQRENLCQAIRFGEIDLQRADLHAYLRQSVFAQVMIDQPGYAGAVEAGKRLT
jgi:aminoglycoside phosphotransferase (APT) family kinase protein